MYSLNSLLSDKDIKEVMEYTRLRFVDPDSFICPESLAIYEQNLLPEEQLRQVYEEACGHSVEVETLTYVDSTFYDIFRGTGLVPLRASALCNSVDVASCDSFEVSMPQCKYEVRVHQVPLYNYVQLYNKAYGYNKALQRLPGKTYFDMITKEAISLHAADLTISSNDNEVSVYYNTLVQHKVDSKRIIPVEAMQEIINYLTSTNPMEDNNKPKYVGISISKEYRGRVCINRKMQGYSITIRLLPNAAFDKTLEDINLTPTTIQFLREEMFDTEPGLRLVVGGTSSGKNTTLLAGLNEIAKNESLKIVSVEQPCEQWLPTIEQFEGHTPEEFQAQVESLLRVNPDIVYITETNERNAQDVMRLANIGKRVFTTLHANSVEEALSRLESITGLDESKVLLSLHSIVHQQLVPDVKNNRVVPRCLYVRLNLHKKTELNKVSSVEKIELLSKWKEGDLDARSLYKSLDSKQ